MSEIDANIIVDGQKTVATIPQEGEIVQDGGEVDATCIVEDSNGKRHKAVKIVNIDDEPTDKSEIDAQILNNNNELITVTEEQEGEVITQDNSEIDFHCLVQKDDGKQLSVKTVELSGDIIKSGGALDATCVVNAEGKNQLAVKVFKRGGGEIIETVYGTNSITFNAKANGLKALTLFGGIEQSGTPTPTTPQDIVCNNGALKYSNNLLDMATENIVLGKYINNSGAVLDSGPNFYNSKYIPVVAGETYTWSTSSSINYFSVMEYDSSYVFKKRTLFSNAGTSGSITLRSDAAFVLIGSNMDGSDVTLDKIATVDWQFEKGSSATTYKPYSPTGIYTDGTVETINMHGKNLFDKNNANILSAFISGSGNVSVSGIDRLIYLQVEAGKTYYVSFTGNGGGRIAFFDNVPSIGSQGVSVRNFYRGGAITVPTGMSYFGFHFNTNSVSLNDMLNTLQIELGSTATDYVPYYDGGTATAEMLLKVGDYQDEEQILSGAVTRNIGVKVFDGSEIFTRVNNTFKYRLAGLPINIKVMCNYFDGDVSPSVITSNQPDLTVKGNSNNNNVVYFKYTAKTTIADFQQWLADRYNAGTPVIVIYPLATPTTETVTPQTLQTQAGTNTISITQASLSSLDLEAKYKRSI